MKISNLLQSALSHNHAASLADIRFPNFRKNLRFIHGSLCPRENSLSSPLETVNRPPATGNWSYSFLCSYEKTALYSSQRAASYPHSCRKLLTLHPIFRLQRRVVPRCFLAPLGGQEISPGTALLSANEHCEPTPTDAHNASLAFPL
jgi:hypothetical protein